jgi:hypothetical protein
MKDENFEMKKLKLGEESTEFLLYTGADEKVKVECCLHGETLWLTQRLIAQLFGVGVPAINKHLKNIYESGELEEKATISKMEIVQSEGGRLVKRYPDFYNLDAIIAVGYRVNSHQATKFRIWATQTLKEYIIKGFVMDDERLKQGNTAFGKDYFRELLERVRSIRASERRIYQQITDIFAECSIDYDPKAKTTRDFYAHIQDKFHFAITGKTSAEIIFQNVDANLPLMGMQTFKNSPDGRVLKSDALIGKNYLSETEIGKLERTVTAFFDYIEGIIERRNTFTMEQFSTSVNKFLEFNEYKALQGFGTITREQADQKAAVEYEKFNKHQKLNSDFDKQIKRLKGNS